MSDFNTLDRQAIVNQVHDHFIVQRLPAGGDAGARCIYHALGEQYRRKALFDSESLINLTIMKFRDRDIDTFCSVFEEPGIDDVAVDFLYAVQDEYDMAVKNAALSDIDFDTYFIEELAHRLDRFAGEYCLDSPCTPRDLGAA